MASRTAVNRQVRGFAVVWTAVTLIIGASAFFAIYVTYDAAADNGSRGGVSIPVTDPPEVAVMIPTATVPPTSVPVAPTDVPEVAMAAAQQEPQPEPTVLPVNNRAYDVGIQVQYSLDMNPDNQRGWMRDVKGLGLDWYKQQIRWIETEPAKGEYNWSVLDLVVPVADEMDVKVMLSIVGAPDWAREPGVDLEAEGPPADYQDFADFLTALLRRYPGQIHAIEVWNEPNIDREWMSAGGVSAANFVELLRVAYETIKNIDPGIIVVSGAPSPTGGYVDPQGVMRAVNDFDYMDQLIAAGLLNYSDCVGAHHNGYNIGPSIHWDNVAPDPNALFRGPFDNPHHSWSFRSTLETYANKIAVAGGDQPLCITEFGWATVEDMDGYPTHFEFAVDNTLEEQAEWTIEALNNMEDWGFVWLAFIWNLNYGPQAGWATDNDNTPYSFIGPDWAHRPVYGAVREWGEARRQASQ
jgi:polysaccharide biosynthesis protein PslG